MRYMTLTIGFLSLAMCHGVSAQVIQQVNQFRVGGPGMFGLDDEELEAAMRVEVDTIRRVTGISDAATKKLDVAAKAAINALKKKKEDDQGIGRTFIPQAPAASGGLSDEDAEKKAADSPAVVPPVFGRTGNTTEAVKNEEIWRKTISNVLNDEQQKKYAQFQSDRSARVRALAVENYVDQLDSHLMLEDTQRAAIIKIVDREIGESLAKQRTFQRFGQFGAVLVMAGMGDKSSVKPDDLREILSSVQLAEMKRQQEVMDQGPLDVLGPKTRKAPNEDKSLFQSSLGFSVAEEAGQLIIREVKPDTPAELAGIQVGDAIDSFDEMPVDTLVQLKRGISKSSKKWSMQVRRQDKLLTVSVP